MHQRRLTDRNLKALKPAASGKLYEVMEAETRGFGVRVNDSGRKTFILLTRYPGSDNPTRRALGEYPTLSLEKARAKAKHWRVLIDEGEDPKDHEAQKKRESQRKREDSFEAVVETYAKRRAVEAAPRRRGEA